MRGFRNRKSTLCTILEIIVNFTEILNDDKWSSELVHNQNLTQESEHHFCHSGAPMLDGRRKKTLKNGTIKVHPIIRWANREYRIQLSIRKNTFFSLLLMH